MKGYLANPSHVKGLNNAIRENDYLFFYMDIVNHRNLTAKEFFKYINDKYGNNYRIMQRIEYMSYNISSYKADKLKIIINYKEADLDNKFEKIKKLEEDFKKIKNVEIEQYDGCNNKNLIRTNAEIKSSVNIDEIKDDLNNLLDDYLSDEIDLSDRELTNFNARLLKHISFIDYKKYIDFFIKMNKIKIVNLGEIDQIIEVLEYFIKNLNNKLYKMEFCDYIIKIKKEEIASYDKEINHLMKKKELCAEEIESQINTLIVLREESEKILESHTNIVRNTYIEGEENLGSSKTESISKLIIWKCQKIKNKLNNYKKVLGYLINFKNAVYNNDGDLSQIPKIYSVEIEDEFIVEMLKNISKILYEYKRVCAISLSDSKLNDVKHYYLKKVYKNN